MAKRDGAETLDSWLNKATDPNNAEDRWDCIQEFYQRVNQQTDGPQVATRLLAHKIQSPQENEALRALTILEACMNHCGRRFHVEAGKFRFLNELIKVLIPKYLGRWSSDRVKERVTEVLYGWTLRLKEDAKIQEAYRLLKKQGIVKKDPTLQDRIAIPPPARRATASVFDQEDKAELLARLLRSSCPEDLRTANALIQNTIREEQEKAEQESKRVSTLKEVETCVSQLRGLLDRTGGTGGLGESSEEITVLYEHCAKLRPSLFRLASETTVDDAALAQILAANDELTLAVTGYRQRVGENEGEKARRAETSEEESSVDAPPTSPRSGVRSYRLIDLSALDGPPTPPLSLTLPPPPSSPLLPSSRSSPPAPRGTEGSHLPGVDLELIDLGSEDRLVSNQRQTPQTLNTYSEDLLLVSRGLQMNEGDECKGRDLSGGTCRPAMRTDSDCSFTQNQRSGLPLSAQSRPQDVSPSPGTLEGSAACVPMETPRTSQLEPITLHHQAGVHVSLNLARDPPGGPPDVAVMVLSAINTSALPVRNFLFQAAVPKGMSVRLQASSGSSLPPFNPLLPPAALSQKLFLSNPQKLKVRLRYKLAFLHGDQPLSEAGETESFPPWTSLADVSN